MPPPPPPPPTSRTTDSRQKVNIRVSDTTATHIHKAAITRDYIKQPRLSTTSTSNSSISSLFFGRFSSL